MTRSSPCPRSRLPRGRLHLEPRWFAAIAIALIAGRAAAAAPGGALSSLDFSLTIGSTFNAGSAIALGTNVGLFTGSRTLDLSLVPTATPGVFEVTIDGTDPLPSIAIALDPTRFEFDFTSAPQLTFDATRGFNPDVTDAPSTLRVERRDSGTLIDSDEYALALTTSSMELLPCGTAPLRTVEGSFVDTDPLDGVIDLVVLVGGLCLVDFGASQNFQQPFEIRLRGSMMQVCPDADDGVACTIDGCDAITFEVVNTPFDGSCDDANVCNGSEVCDPVLDCQPGVPPTVDDGVACTVDSCDPQLGIVHAPDDAFCLDTDVCNGDERCDVAAGCVAGTPLSPDDGVSCTVDECDPSTGPFHVPNDALCADGNVCNGDETCDAALDCQAGVPLALDDGVDCTLDACDPLIGVSHLPSDVLCSDDDLCTGVERCDVALGCQAGTPPTVDDGVACTVDSCDPETGVANLADDALCDDADVCTGAESCDVALGCQAGIPLVVDDGVGCTVDSCDPETGVANLPSDALCDDDDVCTGVEICDGALGCQAGTPLALSDGVDCTVDGCDALTGVFHTAEDALCADGNVCNGDETCDAALDCQAGVPLVLDDGVACTIDSCDPQLGVANVPDDLRCIDGDVCNGEERCDAALGCQTGTPLVVDDEVDCTADSCDPLTGVAHQPMGSRCDDGNFCNGFEYCDAVLGCQAGVPLVPFAAMEDFEGLDLQFDDAGVFVSSVGETFFPIRNGSGAVATVMAPLQGQTGIAEGPLSGRVWTLGGASPGPFIAEAMMPPDPAVGLSNSGSIAAYLRDSADLRAGLMCVDVRDPGEERPVAMHFVVGDANGRFAVSEAVGPLSDEFQTVELNLASDPLTTVGAGAPIDLSRVESVALEFTTAEGTLESFRLEVDNVRIIPEPGPHAALLVALVALAAIRRASPRGGAA